MNDISLGTWGTSFCQSDFWKPWSFKPQWSHLEEGSGLWRPGRFASVFFWEGAVHSVNTLSRAYFLTVVKAQYCFKVPQALFRSEGYNRIVWTERQQQLRIVAHAFPWFPVPLRFGDAKSRRLAGQTCCSKFPACRWVYLSNYSQL